MTQATEKMQIQPVFLGRTEIVLSARKASIR